MLNESTRICVFSVFNMCGDYRVCSAIRAISERITSTFFLQRSSWLDKNCLKSSSNFCDKSSIPHNIRKQINCCKEERTSLWILHYAPRSNVLRFSANSSIFIWRWRRMSWCVCSFEVVVELCWNWTDCGLEDDETCCCVLVETFAAMLLLLSLLSWVKLHAFLSSLLLSLVCELRLLSDMSTTDNKLSLNNNPPQKTIPLHNEKQCVNK